MRRAALILMACALAAAAQGATPETLSRLDPGKRPRLKTVYSTVHDLGQLVKGDCRGVALVFLGTECPVARQYLPRLAELHSEFRASGIRFFGIYSDVGVNVLRMATHALDEEIPFPVLQDVDHRLADWLGVEVTPEVVVLDRRLEKKYQGAIDNQYARHARRPAPTKHYLRDALRAVASASVVEVDHVPASGCPIERRVPQRTPRAVTFYKDIAPLIQKRCQACHRAGGPGPFELVRYDDVAFNAEKIREVVIDRRMPPWHGVLNPEFGKLANDQSLAEDELETLLGWIDAGAPEGNKADAPPPRRWPAPQEWAIGKPDFVYRMPQPFVVPKSGTLEYQFFRVKLDFPLDRWFRAVEIKPGNPEVVHHIALHLAPSESHKRYSGLAAMAQLYGLTGELGRLINDFVPGDTYNAKVYPPDQAVLIPKNHDLIFEVHYTPNNRLATTDQSMVAFQWADAPPRHEVLTTVFRKPVGGFRIPPYEPRYRMEDVYYFPQDVDVDAIRPHFHLRGKSYKLEMIERDPDTDEIINRRTILKVPVFDQGWQRTYELAQPLRVLAGTELLATGYFDNSELNPDNPDPSVEVLWGQQTTDEMFSTRFKYRIPRDTSESR